MSDYAVVHHAEDGREFAVRGRYHVGFTRSQDSSWRISRVSVGVSWVTGDPTVLA